MRALAAVALLALVGCTTVDARRLATLEAQVQALSAKPAKKSATATVEWGGPEASAPVASLGTWVPAQAATKSLLGQAVLSSRGAFGVLTGTNTSSITFGSAGKVVGNGTELDLYGGGIGQIYLTAGHTYLNNLTHLRGTMDNDNGGIVFISDPQGLCVGDGTSTECDGILKSGPFTLGATGTTIDDSYAASSTIDFGSTTTTCNDSTGITVTGAAVNDVCAVGPPASGGSTNATYSCYVSAADTVKVRHCAAGTADDPASATFTVRVFDP